MRGKSLLLAGLAMMLCAVLMPCVAFEIAAPAAINTTPLIDPYANDGMSFRVLCYHDIRDHLRDTLSAWPERSAMDTFDLITQFEWLAANDYHVVSLAQIVAARSGGPPLPARSVLLSFDDGYRSTYTRVFPLLKLFGYPAVIALVGEWLEGAADGEVNYGTQRLPRAQFLNWDEVREMQASGLVEVASHSYGLHRGINGNPQGSSMPAAVTRAFDAHGAGYESEDAFRARLYADLARNSALIEQHTGTRPRAMVWPYGAYNRVGVEVARELGMPLGFTLEAGPNSPERGLDAMRRTLLLFHDKVSDLKASLVQSAARDGADQPLNRIVSIDLDEVYAADSAEQERRLDALIQRLRDLRISAVYLRAWSDVDHDGRAEGVYFPSRHVALRADLFSRVAWQIRTRVAVAPASVLVYAWLPSEAQVLGVDEAQLADVYLDAASHAPLLGGVLIGDEGDTDITPDDQRAQALLQAFRRYQPGALSARLLPLPAQNDADGGIHSAWLARYRQYLSRYDFVALGVSPDESLAPPFQSLFENLRALPHALDTTSFVLRRNALRDAPACNADTVARALDALHTRGARNFGYAWSCADPSQSLSTALATVISLKAHPGDTP